MPWMRSFKLKMQIAFSSRVPPRTPLGELIQRSPDLLVGPVEGIPSPFLSP